MRRDRNAPAGHFGPATLPAMSKDALTADAVAHVAKLARLELPADRIDTYRGQLEGVLEHVAKLRAIDVSGIEPMAYPFESTNRLAEDSISPSMPVDMLLMNAPAVEGRLLAVPKVLAENE